ncbi:hypothetical protein AN220_03960, partial [Streptomyces nanshensis]
MEAVLQRAVGVGVLTGRVHDVQRRAGLRPEGRLDAGPGVGDEAPHVRARRGQRGLHGRPLGTRVQHQDGPARCPRGLRCGLPDRFERGHRVRRARGVGAGQFPEGEGVEGGDHFARAVQQRHVEAECPGRARARGGGGVGEQLLRQRCVQPDRAQREGQVRQWAGPGAWVPCG